MKLFPLPLFLRVALGVVIGSMGLTLGPIPLTAQIPVPVGTRVPVVLVVDVSSQTAKAGDTLVLALASDVILDGHVVMAKGTAVRGVVVTAEKAGRFGHGGQLVVTVDSARAVDGQMVPLVADVRDTTTVTSKTNSRPGQAAQDASQIVDRVPGADLATGFFHHGDDIVYKAHRSIPVFTIGYVVIHVPDTGTDTAAASTVVAAGDTMAGIAPAAMALFDGVVTSDRALAALAAHLSVTPAVRALGLQVVHDDSILQAQGIALAAQHHTPIPPLRTGDRKQLNDLIVTLRKSQDTAFDRAVLQQMYGVEQNFVASIDDQDTSPLGTLLAQAALIWKAHLTRVATVLTSAATPAESSRHGEGGGRGGGGGSRRH